MRSKFLITLAAIACSAFTHPAAAQSWPEGAPIKMVVAFPPGGPADVIARLLSNELQAKVGGSFVVDNRPGAGGTIGTSVVANAKPDGYTLLFTSAVAQAVNPSLMSSVTYDPVKDFEHISLVARGPVAVLVSANAPFKTFESLVAESKKQPVFFGAAIGSVGHLTGELTKRVVDFDLKHVPYKGTGPAMSDLLGGHIQIVTDVLTAHAELIKSGRVRALAVASNERLDSIPDTPTFVELGYKDLVAYSWFGLVGPANMPKPIVEKLNAATREILSQPEFAQRIRQLGMDVTPEIGMDRYVEFTDQEVKKWADVIRSANIQVE